MVDAVFLVSLSCLNWFLACPVAPPRYCAECAPSGDIELLGHSDERDAAGIEDLDHLGEIRQRAREAIDLVDHDRIDQPLAISAISRCSAGRSMVAPERPPSS